MTAPEWLFARPIAHRGLHDRAHGIVENTWSAAEAAIAGGYAIECDVQLTADGEAVVFHDFALDRLTAAHGLVRERTAAELAGIAIGERGDTVVGLAEFLARIDGRTPLVVEVKSRFDGDELLARRTAAIVTERGGPIAVKSFDPDIVALLRRIAPLIPRGIVAQARYDEPEWSGVPEERRRGMASFAHWPETEPGFISYRHQDLPGQFLVMPRILSGVPVMSWTIRSQAEADRALAFADQIVFEGFVPA